MILKKLFKTTFQQFSCPWIFTLIGLILVGLVLFFQVRSIQLQRDYARLQRQYERSQENQYDLSHRQRQFITSLANELDYHLENEGEDIQLKDIIKLTSYLKLEHNKFIQPRYNANFYEILSNIHSDTLPSRDLIGSPISFFSPSLKESSLELNIPIDFKYYQYTIFNVGNSELEVPIVWNQYLWNSAQNLVESTGLRLIENETERAIALWKFVSENRYHWVPVTEAVEEMDLVKYFSVYGYGLCGGSALILSKLANEVGLQSRIWFLNGHIVPEVHAEGKWILLDPDIQIYFHQSGNEEAVYGVEELAQNREYFNTAVFLPNQSVEEQFIITPDLQSVDLRDYYFDVVSSTEDNEILDQRTQNPKSDNLYTQRYTNGATTDYVIRDRLRPREGIVFTNYNWGRYFLGIYPDRVPKYFNGFYDYRFSPQTATHISRNIKAEETDRGYRLTNESVSRAGKIQIDQHYSFPIVGGDIIGLIHHHTGQVNVILKDQDNNLEARYPLLQTINTNAFFNTLDFFPTYRYSVTLELEPNASVELDKNFRIISDFQFADLALLKLNRGSNTFNVYTEHPEQLDQIQFSVALQ